MRFLLGFTLVLMFMIISLSLLSSESLAQMQVDPLTDCEISWNGGGLWTAVPMLQPQFLVGTVGIHKPFAVVGINKFEADVSKVFLGDPNTLLRWNVNVQLQDSPSVTDSVWVTGWIHYKVKVVIGEDYDYAVWSPMQVFHIKTPKQLMAPRLIK